MRFLIAMLMGAVIATVGTGGTVYYLARSGRLLLPTDGAAKAGAAVPAATHVMVLEPMLVNLADVGNSGYLKVSLTLRLADAADKKSTKAKEEKSPHDKDGEIVAAVRDTALSVLGKQTADGLLAADGKDRLKAELKAALAAHNADLKVTDVFFTDFLVQR
jgi:flagellar protein FliL